MTTTPATRATPAVKTLAARLGVNLAAIAPTGVGGRVTTADVKAAATTLDAALHASSARPGRPPTADDAVYAALFPGEDRTPTRRAIPGSDDALWDDLFGGDAA